MFPSHLFALFPPFPRTHQAFVAMSFDPAYDARWHSVIQPALRSIQVAGAPLEPFRVDLSRASDAILDEILRSIAECTIVFADVSASQELNSRAVRNGNVMYEVGLAHASRLPEEVVLFRSDSYRLDFDVSGVRVHQYDPDGSPEAAKRQVSDTVVDSLGALQSRRRIATDTAIRRLTLPAAHMLFEAAMNGHVMHPASKTVSDVLAGVQRTQAITLLLELGALRTEVTRISAEALRSLSKDGAHDPPLLRYVPTPFAEELLKHVGTHMGTLDPEVQALLEAENSAAPGNGAA